MRFLKKPDLFLVLVLVYTLWLLSLKNRQTGGMDDFDIFFKSGERLLGGENIYGPPHHYNLKYFYSVFFAGIMALFQNTGINALKFVWFVLNTALFIRVFFLLKLHVLAEGKRPGIVFFFLLLLTGKMVLVNYTFNQISVLILWTMVESFHQLKQGRMYVAVFLLCLGINIKIMPVVLVPYFLFMGPKPVKMTIAGVLMLLFLLFLPAMFIGWNYNLMLISEWWKTLNPVSDIHVMQTYEYGFTDLSSMVTKFLSAEAVYNEPGLHIANLPRSTLFLIINGLRVALLALVVYLAIRIRKPVSGIDHRVVIVSAFMALIPLCFPHQREYSYMFSIPMLAILLTLLSMHGKVMHFIVFSACVLLSGMLIWVDFAGQEIVDVFRHYRLITMGMTAILLFYVALVLQVSKAGLLQDEVISES